MDMNLKTSVAMVILLCGLTQVLSAPTNQTAQCEYRGQMYSEGDLVTSDPCDLCHCTYLGLMCSLVACPAADCVDKVVPEGKCCPECPNGPNALYQSLGNEPETIPCKLFGCLKSDGFICFCHKLEAFCFPSFPFTMAPACFPNTA